MRTSHAMDVRNCHNFAVNSRTVVMLHLLVMVDLDFATSTGECLVAVF